MWDALEHYGCCVSVDNVDDPNKKALKMKVCRLNKPNKSPENPEDVWSMITNGDSLERTKLQLESSMSDFPTVSGKVVSGKVNVWFANSDLLVVESARQMWIDQSEVEERKYVL